jgi:competence protein ComEC
MLPLFFQLGRFRQQSEEKAIVENDIRYESPLILEPLGVPEVTAKGYRLAVKCHLKDSSDLKILLNVKGTATIDIAKYWTCASLHIQVLPFNRNPGAFDYGDWLQKKGFQAISYVNADKLLELNSSTSRISQQFFKWRWSCVQYIQSKLQGPSSLQIVPALLLGYKSSVDREVRQSFTASGIVHILAVSGMHLGLIYALLQWLLRPFRKSRKGVIVIQLIGIWAFTLLSGLPTSVVRAAIMLSIVLLTSNQNKGLSSLWLTASLMLFLQPEWLIDLGFQLSVLAVFGIVRTASHPLEVNALIDKVFSSFKVTMAAQWHTLPIILGVFRQFPSYFLIGNLLLLPLVSLVLYTALLWSLVLFIFPNWQFLGIILEFLCDLMLQGSSFIASLPNSVLSIPYLQWHIMLLGLAVWLFLSAWRSTRSPYYYLWTSLMLIVFVGFYQSSIQK